MVNGEPMQAESFNHFIAAVPELTLRIYQQPSGYNLGNNEKTASAIYQLK